MREGSRPPTRSLRRSSPAGGEGVSNAADVADFARCRGDGAAGHRDVRRAGHPRQQRRFRTRPDARQHLRGGVGRGHPGAPEGSLRDAAAREVRTGGRSTRKVASAMPGSSTPSSGAGLQGSIGQTTYSAAKAGIAGMTLVAAAEMGRYGVTVNAIAPVAQTRMTEGAFDTSRDGEARGQLARSSPGSPRSRPATSRVASSRSTAARSAWSRAEQRPKKRHWPPLGDRRGRRCPPRPDRQRPARTNPSTEPADPSRRSPTVGDGLRYRHGTAAARFAQTN